MMVEDIFQIKNQFIFNRFKDAILIETANRLVDYANTSFCTLFKIKFTPEELIGTDCKQGSIVSSFLFKNPSKFLNRIEEIIENGKVVQQEEIAFRDGTILIRDYFPIFIQNKIQGHLWMYKVAEKEHAESNPIQQQLQVLHQAIQSIDIPIAIVDIHNCYVFINKSFVSNTDKRAYLLGKTDAQFAAYYNLPTNRAVLHEQYVTKAIASKQTQLFEEIITIKQQKTIWYKTIIQPLIGNNNEVDAVLKYCIDITETKHQEQILQETIEQYVYALQQVNDAVLLTNPELKVLFTNASLFKIFTNTSSQKVDNELFKLISLTNYEFYKQVFTVLSGAEESAEGIIELIQQTGTKKWLKYHVAKGLKNPQNPLGIVAVLNDITDKVQLEENLLEVVKREKELNELKSAFVNMVSHELRTPLAVISSGAEIIQMMLQMGKSTNDIEPYTQQIITEVERMTTFMNDLLMISKIEAGKIDFNPSSTDLFSFIQQLANQSYLPWKDGRSLAIHAKGAAKNVSLDEKMIRHILQNLIDNAFKYSVQQPAPHVRIRYSHSYVTISIIDEGIGIHEEDLQKLFASFSRGRNVNDIAGTGMGLVVVKYFTEQHKGKILVKSKLGKGSIFSVKIPY